VDKPAGPTSHDVVAVARRSLGERQIGHTGTLDPLATGVLPLACGRATRLVRFFTGSDKDYDATVRFGLATDTYDVSGRTTRETGRVPTLEQIDEALESLRGDYLQRPPPYSAKKIGGERAYTLARQQREVVLAAAPVSVTRATLTDMDGPLARFSISCSAGFYVRSFAQDLGERVGTGACLEALRRTRSGEFDLTQAVPLEVLQKGRDEAGSRVLEMERLLSGLPAVRLSSDGRTRISHGLDVDARHALGTDSSDIGSWTPGTWVRLLDERGAMMAVAQPSRSRSDALHPSIVLI
jgi:tRNA pseudouridine55 synthase